MIWAVTYAFLLIAQLVFAQGRFNEPIHNTTTDPGATVISASGCETTLEACTGGSTILINGGTCNVGTLNIDNCNIFPNNGASVTIDVATAFNPGSNLTLAGFTINAADATRCMTFSGSTTNTTIRNNLILGGDAGDCVRFEDNVNNITLEGNKINGGAGPNGSSGHNVNCNGRNESPRPTDITIRNNHLYKDATEMGWPGWGTDTEDLLQLRACCDITFDGNWLEGQFNHGGDDIEELVDLKETGNGCIYTFSNNFVDGRTLESAKKCMILQVEPDHDATSDDNQTDIHGNVFFACDEGNATGAVNYGADSSKPNAFVEGVFDFNLVINQGDGEPNVTFQQFSQSSIRHNTIINGDLAFETGTGPGAQNNFIFFDQNMFLSVDSINNQEFNATNCRENRDPLTTGNLDASCVNTSATDPLLTDCSTSNTNFDCTPTNSAFIGDTGPDGFPSGALIPPTLITTGGSAPEIGNVADDIIVLNLNVYEVIARYSTAPVKNVDTSKITVEYDNVPQSIQSTSVVGSNQIRLDMVGSATSSTVVEITMTKDWCTDSANLGNAMDIIGHEINAGCQAVTNRTITNNINAPPSGRILFANCATGFDGNNGLSSGQAVRTVQRAFDLVQNGDLVIFEGDDANPVVCDLNNGPAALNSHSDVWILAQPRHGVVFSSMESAAKQGTQTWNSIGDNRWEIPNFQMTGGGSDDPYLMGYVDAGGTEHFLLRYTCADLSDHSATFCNGFGNGAILEQGYCFEGGDLRVRLPNNDDPNGREVLIPDTDFSGDGITMANSDDIIFDGFICEGFGSQCIDADTASTGLLVRNFEFKYSQIGVSAGNGAIVEWSRYLMPGLGQYKLDMDALGGTASWRRVFNVVKSYDIGGDCLENQSVEGSIFYSTDPNVENVTVRNSVLIGFDGFRMNGLNNSTLRDSVCFNFGDNCVELESDNDAGGQGLVVRDNHFNSVGFQIYSAQQSSGLQSPIEATIHHNVSIIDAIGVDTTIIDLIKDNVVTTDTDVKFFNNAHRLEEKTIFSNNGGDLVDCCFTLRNEIYSTSFSSNFGSFSPTVSNNILHRPSNVSFVTANNGIHTTTSSPINWVTEFTDFGITSGSIAEDAGIVISGITPPSNVDIGVFEVGAQSGKIAESESDATGTWPRPVVATLDTSVPSGWTGAVPPGDTDPPTTPTGLATTLVTDTQIDLTWNASTDNVGVTNYRLEKCEGAGCSGFSEIQQPTGTTASVIGLSPGSTHNFRVRAEDAAGNLSGFSSTLEVTTTGDSDPPSVPTNLVFTFIGSTQMDISWSASTDNVGVARYRIDRCEGVGCVSFVEIDQPVATTHSSTGLTPSTTYRFRVRAEDTSMNLSGFSTILEGATTSAPAAGIFIGGTVEGGTRQ